MSEGRRAPVRGGGAELLVIVIPKRSPASKAPPVILKQHFLLVWLLVDCKIDIPFWLTNEKAFAKCEAQQDLLLKEHLAWLDGEVA